MTGSPEVIAALLEVHRLLETAKDQLRNQRHYWRMQGWSGLDSWWDKRKEQLDDIHHATLDRLLQLGGMPEDVEIEIHRAYVVTTRTLAAIHDACQAVYAAASDADDYVTIKLLQSNQEELESMQTKTANKLAKVEALGEIPFLAENM